MKSSNDEFILASEVNAFIVNFTKNIKAKRRRITLLFDKTMNNSLLKKILLLKTGKLPKNNEVKYTNGDGSGKLISIYKIISINSTYKKQYIIRRIIDIVKRIVK